MDLEKQIVIRMLPTPPYGFSRTVSKRTRYGALWYLYTPFETFENGILWSGFRLPHGRPVGLKISSIVNRDRPVILAEVFSDSRLGTVDTEAVEGALRTSLGVNVDIAAFYSIAAAHELLLAATSDLYGMRVSPLPDLLSRYLLAVCLQRTSYGRTAQMLKLIYDRYGTRVTFDGRVVVISPDPESLQKVAESELRAECKLGYRARYVKAAVEVVASRRQITLEKLAALSYDAAKAQVMTCEGIGAYSADVILPHPSFPVDSWSARVFSELLNINAQQLGPGGISKHLKDFAREAFGEWQDYAFEYIVNDLDALRDVVRR